MDLKPHQKKVVEESPDKWCLFFKMRVGKTPTAIRLACSRSKHSLIICPKSLKHHWEKEIEKWKIGDCQFTVRSKEDIRLNKNIPPNCDDITVDEAHLNFANFKSKTYKALVLYIRTYKPQRIRLLTGTPYTSSSWSIYSYAILLGKDWSWYQWKKRYFYDVKMGTKIIPKPKTGFDKELQTILRRIGTVIDLKDVADVPDDENIIETFKLNSLQTSLIKQSFDPLPIVRFTKQHQIESGCLKGDGYRNDVSISCDKDSRIIEITESTPKLVIVCRYLAQIDKYDRLLSNKGFKVLKISGQETLSASEVALRAENEPSCVVLIQSDTCNGYSLKSFNTMIFASMSYSYVNYDQMKFRIKAMEKKDPCQYIHFITEGKSVDKAVYDAVSRKQDFSIELFSKQ